MKSANFKASLLAAVTVLFVSQQSLAWKLEDSSSDFLATAGFSVSIVGLVGIMESSKRVDKFVMAQRHALMEAINRDANRMPYIAYRDGIKRIKGELEVAMKEAMTSSSPELELRISRLQRELSAHESVRRQLGLHIFSHMENSQITSAELAARIERRYKSLDRIKSRVSKAYGRSNPFYLIALGGAVLAVVGTSADSLDEVPIDQLYSHLSNEGKDFILSIMDREIEAASNEEDQATMEDLLQ